MTDTLPVPLGHLVLLSIKPVPQYSDGNLRIRSTEDAHRDESATQIGTVVSLGDTAYKSLGDGTPWVKPGDIVYFKRYSGIEYRPLGSESTKVRTIVGDLYRVVNDDDIYAIFPSTEESVE